MRQLTLLLEQLLAPVPGGTGRYSREVAAALAASPMPGWRVTGDVAWHADIAAARVPGVAGPRRLPLGARALAVAWEYGAPPIPAGTVVHALTPLAPPRARRRGSLVVTVHDDVPWTRPETLTPRGVSWHRRMIERAARSAAAIVVPNAAVATGLAEHAGITEKVVVIGEGVSEAFTAPVDSARITVVRERLNLPKRYLVTVGTVEPRKGLDVALDALVVAGPVALPLVVVGPVGWGDIDLAQEIARRGLTGRVLPVGRLSDTDLAAVVAGAVASVTPSRAEGFGLPLAEAMALGIPVIHTAVPALIDTAGGAGHCVPIGDPEALAAALLTIADDTDLAARLAAAGRSRAADHSWPRVADRLWQLYRSLTIG